MKKLLLIIDWLIVVVFLIVFIAYIAAGYTASALLALLVVLIILPPIFNYIKKKLNIPFWSKYILFAIIFILLIFIDPARNLTTQQRVALRLKERNDSINKAKADSIKNIPKIDTLNLELQAKNIAETEVKELLKSPASAQFPDDEQHYGLFKDSTIMIKGAVDAQNTFGAMLRTTYYIKLKWTGDYEKSENWKVVEKGLDE